MTRSRGTNLDREIDVLLPFHKLDTFFDQAVQSVVDSQGVKIRLILIDDSPEQNYTPKILPKDLSGLELVRTGGGLGYGYALKVGSELIQAQAVGLFNSDDLVHPLRFQTQLLTLETNDLSLTGMQRISKNGRKISSLSGEIYSKKYDPLYLLLGSYGANATWVMQSNWWKNNSFFDNQECLDWRIALKSFSATKIHWNPEKLYSYRKHASQVTAKRELFDSRMDCVYDAWKHFAATIGLSNNTETIFNIIATPWLKKKTAIPEEFRNWSSQLLQIAKETEADIYNNFLKLVRRRFLKLALSPNVSTPERVRLGSRGVEEIPGLLKDFLLQLRN